MLCREVYPSANLIEPDAGTVMAVSGLAKRVARKVPCNEGFRQSEKDLAVIMAHVDENRKGRWIEWRCRK